MLASPMVLLPAHIPGPVSCQMTRFRSLLHLALALLASTLPAPAQNNLSVHWEELTGPDFIAGIRQAQGVCLLPFGKIEKRTLLGLALAGSLLWSVPGSAVAILPEHIGSLLHHLHL